MNDKQFKAILLTLLKSMDQNLKQMESASRRGIEVDLDEECSSILIPDHIYKEICRLIDSDHIGFMGIS